MSPTRRIIPIFVPHAGCPNNCVFCDQKRISGSLFPASGQTVRETLDGLEKGAGYELAFYGGSFTAIPTAVQEELLSAAGPYMDNGAVSAIRVSTRPDAVDSEALSRLARYGVKTVELGAQSMSGEVLRLSGRGHTAEDTVRAAKTVKERGFALILQMMTGLPGSTAEEDIRTAQKIITLQPDGVRIYPTVVIRGTALEEMWKNGSYQEHTVEEAMEVCSRILPMFEEAGIPVIRLGLNPTEELSGGIAAAGAYHPALGELVRSRVLRRRMEEMLADVPPGAAVVFSVPRQQLSSAIGQHRENLAYLKERCRLTDIKIRPEALAPDRIRLQIIT